MTTTETGTLTDERISELRRQFPILESHIYLYNCSQGALSKAVQAGMQEYAESWRTSSAPWDDWMGKYDAIRDEFARFINADPDEIAILTSASAGINPIANAVQFDDRNKVVMGEFEFPTMGQIWLAQQARGAEIQFLPAVDNQIPIEAYAKAIDEKTHDRTFDARFVYQWISLRRSRQSPGWRTNGALSSFWTAIRIAARGRSTSKPWAWISTLPAR